MLFTVVKKEQMKQKEQMSLNSKIDRHGGTHHWGG
jgi:hypothetical protein